MTDIAIQGNRIGKQYYIGKVQERYPTLSSQITNAFVAPFHRAGRLLRGQATGAAGLDEAFWALKDVSFEITEGEVVGIIGRNGAGKSTLLKVLSRITEPTAGSAVIHGRVGSLLEVGTGFHPELTGRENVYLNGSILGMKRKEINQNFDEIVAFAEIEKFIDTPIKHYSSGMSVRLAFAVAAHLEPEILIVDEVLAVGDARFQKKCLNKMEDVGQAGRTVLFVSHNMPAVARMCGRVILLEDGKLTLDGSAHDVVSAYMSGEFGSSAQREWADPDKAPAGEVARLRAVRVHTNDGDVKDAMDIRHPIGIDMEYDVLKPSYVLMPHFQLINDEGLRVFVTIDQDPDWRRRPRPVGHYTSTAWIPGNYLAEGTLFVTPALATLAPISQAQFVERDAIAFQVIDTMDGDSARGDWGRKLGGVVRPLLEWTTEFEPNGYFDSQATYGR